MFDVDWSDPNRESVGDRRARKQKEKEVSDKASNKDNADKDSRRDEQNSQASGSGSVRSSMSSVDKQFGFFGGKNRKKGRVLGNSRSVASSTTGAPTIHEQEPTEDNNIVDSPTEATSSVPQDPEAVHTEDHHSGASSKPHGSFPEAFSHTWNENHPGGSLLGYDMASPKPGFRSTLIQNLGDGVSFIKKTTEVNSEPRKKDDRDCLVSKVTLSSSSSGHQPQDVSAKPTQWQLPQHATGESQGLATVPESTTAPNLQGARRLAPMISGLSLSPTASQIPAIATAGESKLGLKRRPKAPLKAPAIVPASQQNVGNPDLWKAPDAWEYSASEPEVSPVEEAAVGLGSEDNSQLALDLASMQREANRMLEAEPGTVLRHLKAKWGDQDVHLATETGARSPQGTQGGADPAVDQAVMYKELEMDRKRWMLAALRQMEANTQPSTAMSKAKEKPKVQKILCLFDSQAATSYHAVSNSGVPIYHLSPDPLSHKRYPNIHPMTCPAVSASAVGVAPEAFSAVNCLPIASILPSSDLPRLLQNIFRVLAPGGYLNIVIVDPLPTPASTGPALRQWLDENLIFNLEQQFRCTNPSRNFPVWLLEAGLRANGSAIVKTSFQAVSPPGGRDADPEQPETISELRAVVGRMLWREIWGSFVGADKWWWEVPAIVDECASRGTFWELRVISACKESEGWNASPRDPGRPAS